MKKDVIYKVLYGLSIALIAGFIIVLIIDFIKYDSVTNSAPFTAYIYVRSIEFLIPSVILFYFGRKIKTKDKENNEKD